MYLKRMFLLLGAVALAAALLWAFVTAPAWLPPISWGPLDSDPEPEWLFV